MQRLGTTLAVVAGALSALPFVAKAATAPSLRALPSAPVLTLSGQGFAPGEQLRLTVLSGHPYRIHVAVSAHGTFSVRIAGRQRCAAWTATAQGSATRLERFRGDGPTCRRPVPPGSPAATAPEPAATSESSPTGATGSTAIVREHFDPGGSGGG